MSTASSQNKRKRQPESEKGSTKKRSRNAAESPSSSAQKINVIHVPRGKNWTPVIVSAPGLSIPPGTSFDAFRQLRTNELLLHSSDHPRVDYTAREHQEGGLEDHIKHYVAIYDPKKKAAQIVEAKCLAIRSTLRAEEQEVRKEEREQMAGKMTLSQRQQLGLEFGTKKSKKAIESLSQNLIRTIDDPAAVAASQEAMKKAIESNPAAAAVLESMAEAAANAPSKDELQAVINEKKPRPKHNPNATEPKDVYPISEIIGTDTLKAVKVKPWFDAVEEGKNVEAGSLFVVKRLEQIIEKNDDDAVQKVKVLKWMAILVKFLKACRKVKGGGLKLPKRDELKEKMGEDMFLIDTVRDKFAPGASALTKWDVDNIMTHMAVCSLIVDEFNSDTYDLRFDLGLGPRQMNQYFREIGARIVKLTEAQRSRLEMTQAVALEHKYAKLPAPPEFPIEQNSRVRRTR